MLSVENVSIQFLGRVLYKDLSFTVSAKDRVCFAGPNGAGKSTLMKIIAGLMTPDTGIINKAKYTEVGYLPQDGIKHSGKTLFNEAETAFENEIIIKEKIENYGELLGQLDAKSQEYKDALNTYGELQLKLDNFDVSKMKPNIEKILSGLGFKDSDFTRNTSEFSGGWQMRLALAKLLLKGPSILLLDEPTNHLDIDSQLWLENYIQGYQGAVIIISHDSAFLDLLVKKTLAFESGRVSEFSGNYSYYLEQSDLLRKQLQRAFDNQQRDIAKAEQFINRFRSKARRASQAQSRLKQLEKIERIEAPQNSEKAIKLEFPQPERSGQIVIELTDVEKAYGSNVVFNKLNFRIDRGEKIAVVGANGAGKSTFSRILSDSEKVDRGIRKTGHKVSISHFAQDHAEKLNPNITVLETIEEVATSEIAGNLRSLLGCFLFRGDDVFKKVDVLSGGERSRLSLAKILLKPANFLILDEPTNHLDMQSQKVLQDALISYKGTLLIVSHNRDFLDPITNKVIEFYSDGKPMKTFIGNLSSFIEARSVDVLNNSTKPSNTKLQKNTNSRKEIRKAQGKARQKKSEAIKPLQNELDEIESDIEKCERRKTEIEKNMNSEDFFKSNDHIEITEEYKSLLVKLEKLFSNWSTTSDQIDEISNEYDKIINEI